MRAIVVGLLLAGVGACDSTGPEVAPHFEEYRLYSHAIFDTPEECEAAQPPGWFFNCEQTAEFFPDGRAQLMVTDIINVGEYALRSASLRINLRNSAEVGPRWDFRIEDDGARLVDAYGNEWLLIESGEVPCWYGESPELC